MPAFATFVCQADRRMAAPIALRRADAAARFDLDADIEHGHLRAGDRAEQHELVQIAQMADAEQLAGDFGEAGAEREIVALEGARDDLGAIDAFGHHDRGHGVGVPLRSGRAQLQLPALENRGAHAGGEIGMPVEHILQPLLGEHGERLAQPVHHRQRRRVREIAAGIRLHHVGVVEVAAPRGCGFRRFQRLLADAGHAEAGGQHQALLRAADAHVHAPFVHAKIDAGQGADRIHEQQRRVLDAVHRLAHGGDITGHAGGRFVLAHQHGLDLVLLIGAQ